MTKTMDYQKQGADFLKETGVTMDVKYLKHDFHFAGDKDKRDIYEVTFKRGNRAFIVNFGQSINDSAFKITNMSGIVTHTFDRARLEAENCINKTDSKPDSGFKRKAGEINRIMFDRAFFSLSGCKVIYPKTPGAYDLLTGITKNDPGTFKDFCGDFGYDEDSRTAEKTYKAVCDEWQNVKTIWTDAEIEKLQEIQ